MPKKMPLVDAYQNFIPSFKYCEVMHIALKGLILPLSTVQIPYHSNSEVVCGAASHFTTVL